MNKNDIKFALIFSSCLIPFPILGLFSSPLWVWLIYFSWISLILCVDGDSAKKKIKRIKQIEKSKFNKYDVENRTFKTFDLKTKKDV